MTLVCHSIQFNGRLLKRGFWLYVWQIRHGEEIVYYVGRTGDSSSRNAGSPLSRINMHFDLRPNAKGNTLIRRIRDRGFNPELYEFRVVAVGPIFPEQLSFDAHKPFRDVVATLEHALAAHYRNKGCEILGVHSAAAPLDQSLFDEALRLFDSSLFAAQG